VTVRPLLLLALLAPQALAGLAADVGKALREKDGAERASALRAAAGAAGGAGRTERDRAASAIEKALRTEADPRVRLAAFDLLRALGTERALDRVAAAALDPAGEVRAHLRALLRERADPALFAAVVRALREDASWRMRAAMVEMLLGAARRSSISPLVDALADPHPAVVSAAAEALERLTGEPLGADAEAWRRHFAGEAKRASQGSETRTTAEDALLEVQPGPIRGIRPLLYNVPVTAKRVIFVVDMSSSLRASSRSGHFAELKRAILALPSDVEINVLCFDQRLFFFASAKALARATLDGKTELERWVDGLPAGDKTDVTRAVASGLAMLREAIAAGGAADGELFILTDGLETVTSMSPEAVEAQFAKLPEGRCRVHVIALGGRGTPPVLRRLAERSGGVYVEAGA
jgi:Mg-chelatase subunit ChlD